MSNEGFFPVSSVGAPAGKSLKSNGDGSSSWEDGGVLLNEEHSSLLTDEDTVNTDNPPATDVLHSYEYTKLSATSRIIASYKAVVKNSSGATMRVRAFHGSTGLKGRTQVLAAADYLVFDVEEEITGLGAGAVTLGMWWSTSSSTGTCDASSSWNEFATIDIREME
jgi:hypothetical protein